MLGEMSLPEAVAKLTLNDCFAQVYDKAVLQSLPEAASEAPSLQSFSSLWEINLDHIFIGGCPENLSSLFRELQSALLVAWGCSLIRFQECYMEVLLLGLWKI